jgi:uncharacterized protein GlcG (DUF336 family)
MQLDQADAIANFTLAAAKDRKTAPMAVVVLDAGGNLVVAKRQDGCGIARLDLAHGKAWGSLGMGFGTRSLAQRAGAGAATFLLAASTMLDGRLLPSPGGVLVYDPAGVLLGAVGVSGDTGDIDEACALAALSTAGLTGMT